MKKILLPCITSVMLTFLFCSLFTQPEPSLNHLDEKIDKAKKQSIKPIHDYFAKPESLIIYPRKETKYTFLCCRT
ncbi:MAG TPA: hypothetical protein VKO63_09570, partial [Chitinispirillaceae bacterium]|nr:hypothetical protein [Chitinispirillaceae bacterium]